MGDVSDFSLTDFVPMSYAFLFLCYKVKDQRSGVSWLRPSVGKLLGGVPSSYLFHQQYAVRNFLCYQDYYLRPSRSCYHEHLGRFYLLHLDYIYISDGNDNKIFEESRLTWDQPHPASSHYQ